MLFVGKEPNLRWRTFGRCVFRLARRVGVRRIVFVGLVRRPGAPHPVAATVRHLLRREPVAGDGAIRRAPHGYRGPISFATYLMTHAKTGGRGHGLVRGRNPRLPEGTNPASIEAVTRRLAKLLGLHLDLVPLRVASTAWELQVSQVVEQNEELAETVRKLENAYDNELIRPDAEPA